MTDDQTTKDDRTDFIDGILREASGVSEASNEQPDKPDKPKGTGKTQRPKHYLIGRKIHRKLVKASRLKNRKRRKFRSKRRSGK